MQKVYYKTFGPIKNYYGYIIHLAVVDDWLITNVHTPYGKKQVKYFTNENTLTEYINLLNEDRRY